MEYREGNRGIGEGKWGKGVTKRRKEEEKRVKVHFYWYI